MELARNFLYALDCFFVAVREIRFKYRHQGVYHQGQGFGILRLTVLEVLDRTQGFLTYTCQILEFSLQGIDFGLQGLVLCRECLNLFASDLDKFGVTFLFGIMERFFAGCFGLHRLNLATDTFYRFLRLRKNTRKAQAKEYLGE